MDRTPVGSSVLAGVGYDPERRILEIEFTTGAVYRYRDVPAEAYQELMRADSHGTVFNHRIRDHYRYVRLSRSGPAERA